MQFSAVQVFDLDIRTEHFLLCFHFCPLEVMEVTGIIYLLLAESTHFKTILYCFSFYFLATLYMPTLLCFSGASVYIEDPVYT